jgi:hypothetical protein
MHQKALPEILRTKLMRAQTPSFTTSATTATSSGLRLSNSSPTTATEQNAYAPTMPTSQPGGTSDER